jgi:hypothetical protein
MPYLDKIVSTINQGIINDSLKGIAPAKINACCIAETMLDVREDETGKTVNLRYPALIDNDGEVTMIMVDDSYDIIFYHKVETITNALAPKSSYGDSYGNLLETANMSLIVMAFRNKVRKPAWWFESAIKDQAKDTIKLNTAENIFLQRSVIRFGNSSFDKLSLLQREYSEVALNYPNIIVLELKYSIQSIWKKGCFLNCNC